MAKTERFELRLDSSLLEQIDKWRDARFNSPSRAEAVRLLVEKGLSLETVTPSEGLIMLMLKGIYENLKIQSDAVDPGLIIDAITTGNTWALEWKHASIYHNKTSSPEVLSEVLDIFDMWRVMKYSFERMAPEDQQHVIDNAKFIDPSKPFPGFDGNNESEYVSVAHFLVEKLDRYSEQKQALKENNFNSHHPTLTSYRRMVEVYKSLIRSKSVLAGADFTKEELITILKAPYTK